MTTLGIIGAGQLGRMMALAAAPLGIRTRVLDESTSPCAKDVGELVTGPLNDPATLKRFAEGLDAVTYEFEHFPVETLDQLSDLVDGLVYPSRTSLETAQHRQRQKTCFDESGIPTARWIPIDSLDQLHHAIAPPSSSFKFPLMLKRSFGGYDGRGQMIARTPADVDVAWSRLGFGHIILEELIPFTRELSIVGVRDARGSVRFYPIVENEHREGILFRTTAPAPNLSPAIVAEAQSKAARLAEKLNHVGVFTIELFEVDGRLLANEFASRVHNTGHWTIEAAATSQFDNHIRAVMGMPLGETQQTSPAVMINIIGAMPDSAAILEIPGTHLHVYGKQPNPRRKLGHVTVTAADERSLSERVAQLLPVLHAGGAELVQRA